MISSFRPTWICFNVNVYLLLWQTKIGYAYLFFVGCLLFLLCSFVGFVMFVVDSKSLHPTNLKKSGKLPRDPSVADLTLREGEDCQQWGATRVGPLPVIAGVILLMAKNPGPIW